MPPKKKAVKGVAGGKGNGGNTSATLAAAQMETPAVVERPMSTTPSAITSTIYEHNENRGIEQAFNHHGKKATGKARFQEDWTRTSPGPEDWSGGALGLGVGSDGGRSSVSSDPRPTRAGDAGRWGEIKPAWNNAPSPIISPRDGRQHGRPSSRATGEWQDPSESRRNSNARWEVPGGSGGGRNGDHSPGGAPGGWNMPIPSPRPSATSIPIVTTAPSPPPADPIRLSSHSVSNLNSRGPSPVPPVRIGDDRPSVKPSTSSASIRTVPPNTTRNIPTPTGFPLVSGAASTRIGSPSPSVAMVLSENGKGGKINFVPMSYSGGKKSGIGSMPLGTTPSSLLAARNTGGATPNAFTTMAMPTPGGGTKIPLNMQTPHHTGGGLPMSMPSPQHESMEMPYPQPYQALGAHYETDEDQLEPDVFQAGPSNHHRASIERQSSRLSQAHSPPPVQPTRLHSQSPHSHAYHIAKTDLANGTETNRRLTTYASPVLTHNMRILESGGLALKEAHRAMYGTHRPANQRFWWTLRKDHDMNVSGLLDWVMSMSWGLGELGLRKFLSWRSRGALLVNAAFRPWRNPEEPAFDWLTFEDAQKTRDRTLQESIATYDPSSTVLVFVFLVSESGNSLGIWRRKVTIPPSLQLHHNIEIDAILKKLAKSPPVIQVDNEIHIPGRTSTSDHPIYADTLIPSPLKNSPPAPPIPAQSPPSPTPLSGPLLHQHHHPAKLKKLQKERKKKEKGPRRWWLLGLRKKSKTSS